MTNGTRPPQVERLMMGELVCWRVRTQAAELLVAQQGAQVLSYQRVGEPPLIWLSEQATYENGRSVRGGVPVCWPWFGDLRRNPQAVQAMHEGGNLMPSHGLVRDLEWNLLGIDKRDDGVNLDFAFNSVEQPLANWPQAAELKLRIRLDQHLHLDLVSRNLGDAPLALSQALHSYFAVGDVRQAQVEGLQGCRYIDTLDDWTERQQLDPLRFTGETDRIYLDTPAHLSILDPVWQRRIQLRSSGSRSAVLWNPWTDKAKRLSQFSSDAWQGMLCIEHANALEDLVMLAPGAEHRLSVSLWSEPLAG